MLILYLLYPHYPHSSNNIVPQSITSDNNDFYRFYNSIEDVLNDLKDRGATVFKEEIEKIENSGSYKIKIKRCMSSQSEDLKKFLEQNFKIVSKGDYTQGNNHIWLNAKIKKQSNMSDKT
ncbi:MAG: hypothetical protein QW745_08565 [Thermoplasmata archaeon]